MRERHAMGCLVLLLGCGPVLLGEEEGLGSPVAVPSGAESPVNPDALLPVTPGIEVAVSVRSVDCGSCFELDATGTGGLPPYVFEWEDGSHREHRRVCPEGSGSFSVFVSDQASVRSAVQSIRLESAADTGCSTVTSGTPPSPGTATPLAPTATPSPVDPPSAPTPSASPSPPLANMLCLENLSFEGTPTVNFGVPDLFDAAPWNSCTHSVAVNTPNIVNEAVELPEFLVNPPRPRDGNTYLSLAEGYQTSQSLCRPVSEETAMSVELDLARIPVATGIVPDTEKVFLEIWGGLTADCSQRELLWASPALAAGWKRFCVSLRPHAFFDQLTLRANSDKTLDSLAFLIVDNMKVVDSCP